MKSKSIFWLLLTLGLMTLASTEALAVGVGKTCEGLAGLQCYAGLFCQKKAGSCGIFDLTGRCTRVPRICPRLVWPVCGCDGKTYNNDCERQQAMVSKSHDGKCE
jgi:Kazal-type serine protease inhibitor-like protein